jgi:leucyl aminopeptidase
MRISVETHSPAEKPADLLALPLVALDPAHWRLPARLSALDRGLGGRLARVVAAGDFRGKRGETLLLYGGDGLAVARVLLVGLGPEPELGAAVLREAAGAAVAAALARKAARVALACPSSRRLRPRNALQALAEGATLASYRFDRYRKPREEGTARIASLALLVEKASDLAGLRAAASQGVLHAECQNLARDLSNEPPSVLPPAALGRAAERVAREVGLRCRVLGPEELRRHKMGALLAVGGGSAHPPCLVVLEHGATPRRQRESPRGGRRRRTLCLVGKGVTFDSGGLSLKPATGMVTMKHDMSGGAAVIAALRAAALLKLPLHVVGLVGAVENMPSGTAYRPDDIVTTASGQTVEISNTDAEGRLVLADCLHYARSEFAPDAIVDLATLTGGCSVALGPWAAAVLGNHDPLCDAVRRAGDEAGERFWPLPLWDVHREHMRGEIADVKQTAGRDGSTITAAAFLSYFVGDVPWAHLDIASTANTDRPNALQPRGATGFGVRTLVELMRSFARAPVV